MNVKFATHVELAPGESWAMNSIPRRQSAATFHPSFTLLYAPIEPAYRSDNLAASVNSLWPAGPSRASHRRQQFLPCTEQGVEQEEDGRQLARPLDVRRLGARSGLAVNT